MLTEDNRKSTVTNRSNNINNKVSNSIISNNNTQITCLEVIFLVLILETYFLPFLNHFLGYQQQQQSSTWSQASQQQQRQYQQQFQQQRQQQQKMAWQEQQSSTYSASRRKTWAESSVFHGGIAFAGSSGSGYHEHSCPASGLHSATVTKETPYKFERQTATGHRLFLPTISN